VGLAWWPAIGAAGFSLEDKLCQTNPATTVAKISGISIGQHDAIVINHIGMYSRGRKRLMDSLDNFQAKWGMLWQTYYHQQKRR